MSSEQQLQAILEQMHANAATITNNDTSTTEEEKANPEVFAELQAILGKMHGAQFMNSHSRETLYRMEQNSSYLRSLTLDGVNSTHKYSDGHRYFSSSSVDDYSTLGEHMVNHTHLTSLTVNIHESEALQSTTLPSGSTNPGFTMRRLSSEVIMAQTFFDGLRQNSSINALTLTSSINNVNGLVWRPILMVYRMNNNLIRLHIESIALNNGGAKVVAITLRRCTNLREIRLCGCEMTNEQLQPMVEAMRGCSLEVLSLSGNRIGDSGCRTLATLLRDPNCNLQHLDVTNNEISVAGTNALANSLVNNTKLKKLVLVGRYDYLHKKILHEFTRLVCNTSSISATFCSNHTLTSLLADSIYYPWSTTYVFNDEYLSNLLSLNGGTNKSNVAIKKILQHRVIDMAPLFQLDSEDEWSLKLLPYAIAWFERARKAVSNDIFLPPQTKRELRTRRLAAIYQFTQAMPMLFVPKVEDKKRKREDNEDAKK